MPNEPDKSSLTRRELFSGLFAPLRRALEATSEGRAKQAPGASTSGAAGDLIAVVAGRDCLAYHEIACSVCVQRCPVKGALVLESGLPRVVPALCTGCAACREVCPAPENAIHMVARPAGLPKAIGARGAKRQEGKG